ncbi:hypothetical protein ACOMHN_057134 [Nucella lapillus]
MGTVSARAHGNNDWHNVTGVYGNRNGHSVRTQGNSDGHSVTGAHGNRNWHSVRAHVNSDGYSVTGAHGNSNEYSVTGAHSKCMGTVPGHMTTVIGSVSHWHMATVMGTLLPL